MNATASWQVDRNLTHGRQRTTARQALADAIVAWRRALIVVAASLLAACGGSDGNLDGPAPAAPAAPTAAPVARVEILSDSAWLPGSGQTKQLAAQAYDAAGNPVSTTISWTSSRASNVAVDAAGRLTSQVAAGSAQITAQAGGVSSAPILAFVAAPAAGVIVVDDSAIVGDPVDTDPSAAASLTNTYQVTLAGAAPAVGSLLLGSGDKSLAGRVTAVTTMGAQTRVTLRLVPIDELFASLHIEEVFDLSRAEVLVPPEVAAEFNVARSGNTWRFTPRPQPAGSERQRPLNVIVPREIRPFGTCDATVFGPGDVRNLLIGVEQPSFSITVNPALDLHYDRLSGSTRFIVSAEPLVKLGATLRVSMPLKGEVTCSLKLFQIRLPIGGPLAFFFGGTAPVGVGFKLEGEAAPTTFKVGGQTEIGTKLSLGWNCPGTDCEFVQSMEDLSATFTPVFDPLDPIQFARLSSKLHLFGSMDLEIGHPFLRALRFKGLEGKFGPALKGNFAPPVEQLRDAAYMSDYSAMMKGEVKLGLNIADILAQLGLTGRLRPSLLLLEYELASSPKALKIEADRATFGAGDTVNVRVRLDPATLTFLPGLYNVESVQLRRSVSGLTEVLATQTASPGQEVFDFSVSAPHAGEVSEWSAFVTTRLLNFELASLELGQPTPMRVRVGAAFPAAMLPGDTATFTLTAMDHNSQPVAGLHVGIEASGGTVSRTSGNTDANGQFMVLATLGLQSPSISVTATVRDVPNGAVLDTITRTAVSLASSPGVRLLRRWSGREVPHLQVAAVFNYDSRNVFSDVKEDGPSNPEDFSNLSANLNAIGSGSFDGTTASAQAQGTVTETIRIVNGSFEDTHNAVSFSTQATMTDPPPYPNPNPNEVTHLATSYAFTSYTSCIAFEVMGRDVSFALEIRGSGSPEMLVSANLGVGVSAVARDIVQYSSRGPTVAESRAGTLAAGATYTFCSASVGKALWESWRRTQLQTTVNGQVDVRLSLRPVPQQ